MIVRPNSYNKAWSLQSTLTSIDDSSVTCASEVNLLDSFFPEDFFNNKYYMVISQSSTNTTTKSRALQQDGSSNSQSSVLLYSMVLDCQDGKCPNGTKPTLAGSTLSQDLETWSMVFVLAGAGAIILATAMISAIIIAVVMCRRSSKPKQQVEFDPI
ncbi:hypothetical protein AKO1_013384, partial [Acrasis kona]